MLQWEKENNNYAKLNQQMEQSMVDAINQDYHLSLNALNDGLGIDTIKFKPNINGGVLII